MHGNITHGALVQSPIPHAYSTAVTRPAPNGRALETVEPSARPTRRRSPAARGGSLARHDTGVGEHLVRLAHGLRIGRRRPWGRRHRLRLLDVRSNGIGQMGAQALAKLGLGEGLQVGVVINLARTPSGRFQVPGM